MVAGRERPSTTQIFGAHPFLFMLFVAVFGAPTHLARPRDRPVSGTMPALPDGGNGRKAVVAGIYALLDYWGGSCSTNMVAPARLGRRAPGSRKPNRLAAFRASPSIPGARKTKDTGRCAGGEDRSRHRDTGARQRNVSARSSTHRLPSRPLVALSLGAGSTRDGRSGWAVHAARIGPKAAR